MIEDNPYWRPSKKEIISREALLYFVWEREAIKIAKDNKYQGVLTADPILSKYKFTNIRRKDDRVSKWIIKNIIEVECEQDLWFSLLIARLINWPPTLKYLIDENFLLHSAEKFDAVKFVKAGSKIIGGQGGGGRKDFAQAGGQDKDKINEAFLLIKKLI